MGNSVSIFREAINNDSKGYCAGNPLPDVGSHNSKLKRSAKALCFKFSGKIVTKSRRLLSPMATGNGATGTGTILKK